MLQSDITNGECEDISRNGHILKRGEILKPLSDLRLSLDLLPVTALLDAIVSYGSSFFTYLVEALVSKSFWSRVA